MNTIFKTRAKIRYNVRVKRTLGASSRSSLILLSLFLPFLTCQNASSSTDSLPEVIEASQRSVVNIQVNRSVYMNYKHTPSFSEQWLMDYFEKNIPSATRSVSFPSLGSGVIMTSTGRILTNAHVVSRASQIVVVTKDKKTFPAVLIGKNEKEDLALLKIEPTEDLRAVPMANSDTVKAGEEVLAIGTPYGYEYTVTRGIVSAIHRELKDGDQVRFPDMIQTDTSVNPGNSGGPLLNAKGEMVGLMTVVDSRAKGIGFAIPSNRIKSLMDDLISQKIKASELEQFKFSVGFTLKEIKSSDGEDQLVMEEVFAGSPAQGSGLKADDILLTVQSKPVHTIEGFIEEMKKIKRGERIRLEIIRGQNVYFTNVRLK